MESNQPLDTTASATVPANAIVVVFDGLSPGFLGPYGNTWVETRAFNDLAADAVLVEQAIADCPVSAGSDVRPYFGFWDGLHVMNERRPHPGQLIADCRQRQIHTYLITDAPEFATACAELGFDHIQTLPPINDPQPADDVANTRFAQLVGETIGLLEQIEEPYFIWVHAASLVKIWDAPSSFLQELLDDDDPDPPSSSTPPQLELSADVDPDVSWGWSVLYAAQVRVIDACLGILLDAVRALPTWDSTLFALTATHGFPLGEHQQVGPQGATLHSELVHVPLLVRFPESRHAAVRLQTICQPATLFATLSESFGCADQTCPVPSLQRCLRGEAAPLRAVSQVGDCRSIRTPAWHALTPGETDEFQLYVKPDDRWDFNEVAQRCPRIVRVLQEELDRYQQAAREDRIAELPPLPGDLVEWHE